MPPKTKITTKGRTRTKPLSTVEENFRLRLPEARRARGFSSQAQLAEHLTQLGYPMHETTLARIESGDRKVTLADAAVITAALGCEFVHLVTPSDDDAAMVALAPGMKVQARDVRRWLRGETPLFLEDWRLYRYGPLVPESELGSHQPSAGYVGEMPLGSREKVHRDVKPTRGGETK
jgi:hypothetical protein